jgi:hypothetical protein
VNNRTRNLLERMIKLATNVHWLHGRAEISKDSYEELRGLVKEAMEELKPKEPPMAAIKQAAEGIKRLLDQGRSAGIYAPATIGRVELDASRAMPVSHQILFYSDGGVHVADAVADQSEPMWHGYRQSDVLACARVRHPLCKYEIEDGLIVKIHPDGSKSSTAWHELATEPFLRRENGLRRPDEPDYKKLG